MFTFNKNQAVSLITKAIVAASTSWATSHGFTASNWTNLIAYSVGAGAILFAHKWQSSPKDPPSSTQLSCGCKLVLIAASLSVLNGCAYLNSTTRHQTTTYYRGTNVVVEVVETTHGRAWTLLDANSSLTKFRNQSSPSTNGTNTYAPGTFASGINESSSSTNLLNGVSQITAAAVSAFVQSAK